MNQNSNNDNNETYSHSNHNANKSSSSESHYYIKERRILSKIATVSCVLIILVGTVATIALSGILGNNSDVMVNAEESSTESDTSVEEDVSDEASLESSVPEEPQKPVYSTNAEFTVNDIALSDDTIEYLDEKVTSEFIVLYDATTDQIIYHKNEEEKCYPASTTKMLTAIVASSIIDSDTEITVGDEIKLIGEDSSTAGLQIGDKLTFEMLMDALILPSGNDAAYTVAVNAARIYKDDQSLSNEEALSIFMELVNDAAQQIGAKDTHFVTPDGWHDDDHYTTATDLAKIAAYARTIPLVKESVGKAYAKWDLLSGGTAEWYNSNKLLLYGSGVYSQYIDGMKTGFTDEAGTSVVASATIDGHTMIAVVMNGENLYKKYEDANLLFKAGFELYDLQYTYG